MNDNEMDTIENSRSTAIRTTIGALAGVCLLGGYTLSKSGGIKTDIETHRIVTTTYTKTDDGIGKIVDNDSEYLSDFEINDLKVAEIKDKTTWEEFEPYAFVKAIKGFDHYRTVNEGNLYYNQIAPEELDKLVNAFEEGQIEDLTKSTVDNYILENLPTAAENIGSWNWNHNWKLTAQRTKGEEIGNEGKEKYASSTLTTRTVDKTAEPIIRKATFSETVNQNPGVVAGIVVGAMLGAALPLVHSMEKEERRKKLTPAKRK